MLKAQVSFTVSSVHATIGVITLQAQIL